MLAPATALAAQRVPACEDDRVSVEGTFGGRWVGAIESACEALRSLQDRDGEARVVLRGDPAGRVRVRVELADGRSAERVAASPEDLPRVIEALVTVPPTEEVTPAEPEPADPKEPPPAPRESSPREDAPRRASSAPAPTEGIALSFDVSALLAFRVLGPTATLGPGLILAGDIDIAHGWIIGLRLRGDPVLFHVDHGLQLESATLGGGLELARRFELASVAALDAGLGVDGLCDIPWDNAHTLAMTGPHGDKRGAEGDVRPRAFAKILVPGRGLSFIGQVGLEVSPLRAASDKPAPWIGGEVAAGIAWGSR